MVKIDMTELLQKLGHQKFFFWNSGFFENFFSLKRLRIKKKPLKNNWNMVKIEMTEVLQKLGHQLFL